MGTWTPVTLPYPGVWPGNIALLTDGRVLLDTPTRSIWYTLTPDANGSYANGRWDEVPSSHLGRLFNTSFVLRDGRFFLCGGEYVSDFYEPETHPSLSGYAHCEFFDPTTNLWTTAPDMPEKIGDSPAAELANGDILQLSYPTSNTFKFTSYQTTPAWTTAASYDRVGIDSEGDCLLLQDGSAFCGKPEFRRYLPGPNAWATTAATPGASRDEFTSVTNHGEIGPLVLLPSGKALVFGANAHNGLYTPPTTSNICTSSSGPAADCGSWVLAADTPAPYNHGDSPAVVESNGRVLTVVTTAQDGGGQPGMNDPTGVLGPISLLEFDPSFEPCPPNNPTCSWVLLGSPPGVSLNVGNRVRLLNLPNGQILLTGISTGMTYLYTPTGSPQSTWRPTLTGISAPTAGVFTVSGTQLNGLMSGGSIGDDAKMATNYPVAWLTDGTGHVYYARTFNFDQMSPRPSTAGSFQMTLPANVPAGTYQVHVSANGIEAATTLPLTVSGMHVSALTPAAAAGANIGSSVTWTVTISAAAPAGGTVVNLSSSATNIATVPATVTVPQGATSATFPVTTQGFGRATISAVTSIANANFQPATQFFGWTLKSLANADVFGPPIVYGDTQVTWSVYLSANAPPQGFVVSLTSSAPSIATVPVTVTIPGGSDHTTFTITKAPGGIEGISIITASTANGSLTYALRTGTPLMIPSSPTLAPMGFFKCADKGGSCFVGSPGTFGPRGPALEPKYLAFGGNGSYVFLSSRGTITCDASFFGSDPAPGQAEACYYAAYHPLAAEGAASSISGTANVAFGQGTDFSYKEISGSFTCDATTFSAPAGSGRQCYNGPHSYTYVAQEGGSVTVGTKTSVAYGAAGAFVFRVMTGTFTCNNDTFGDPSRDHTKACYTFNYPFRADEGQAYNVTPGLNPRVYYGSGMNGNFVIGASATGTCSTAFFTGQDPDAGHPKHCWGP